MPQLKCTVQTCVHNKQFLCDLDEITVGGESAKNPKETCCDSFQERKEGSYTNSMKEASDCSCVDCNDSDRLMFRINKSPTETQIFSCRNGLIFLSDPIFRNSLFDKILFHCIRF